MKKEKNDSEGETKSSEARAKTHGELFPDFKGNQQNSNIFLDGFQNFYGPGIAYASHFPPF